MLDSIDRCRASLINKAIDRYKHRWGFYPVNTDAFIQSVERHGLYLAIAVAH